MYKLYKEDPLHLGWGDWKHIGDYESFVSAIDAINQNQNDGNVLSKITVNPNIYDPDGSNLIAYDVTKKVPYDDDMLFVRKRWLIVGGKKKDVEPEVDMKTIIKRLVDINGENQITYVEEECSELIQEICKVRRGKGRREKLVEETCDVITTAVVLMYELGFQEKDILDRMRYKIERAIERYETNGEK